MSKRSLDQSKELYICNCCDPNWHVGQVVSTPDFLISTVTVAAVALGSCARCALISTQYIVYPYYASANAYGLRNLNYCVHCNTRTCDRGKSHCPFN